MKSRQNHRMLVFCAAFAALTCLATLVVQIPSPLTGFLNLGDALVITSAVLLGPVYGTLAAGVGSCLADVISGYAIYAPATLIIKALVALVACLIVRAMRRVNTLSVLVGGIAGESIMVLGYFAYDALFLGYGIGAAVTVPANLMQALLGIVIALVIIPLLRKIPYISN